MDTVITGTSNGLGKELRKLFEGKVIVINRTPTKASNEIICDLSMPKDIQKAKEKLSTLLISSNVLFILNAGIYGEDEDISDITTEGLSKVIYTNVFSQLNFIEYLLKEGRKVKLIAISSQMASIKFALEPYHYVYGVSKAGLNLSIRLLKKEYGTLDYFIVDPGWMRTRMGGDNATDDPTDVAMRILEESRKESNWNRDDGMVEVNKKQIVPW